MTKYYGDQLSLIADAKCLSSDIQTDWAIDTAQNWDRSFDDFKSDRVADPNGGQTRRSPIPMEGKRETQSIDLGPMEGNPDRRGWFEIQKRKGGSYRYFRWRDSDGRKRSEYIGIVD